MVGEKRKGFEDLEIWQLARELTNRVYDITKSFPSEEKFGLTNQMRRASVSVMSNIAEGWGRHSMASFANFLDQAQGSLNEVLSQLYVALDQDYIEESAFVQIRESIDVLGAKAYKFITRLRPNVVREDPAPYDP
jgi:four helix bundle protein